MKKNLPLVTVSIPTFNSEPFLETCLDALKKQSYRNIEIIVIDGGSKDRTLEIIKKNNVQKILNCPGSLMEARFMGVKQSRGKYSLILDSDQVIGIETIIKCIKNVRNKKFDMIILGEDSYSKRTFVEKLFHLDKVLVDSVRDTDPYTSVVLPRFYKTSLIKKAYSRIPSEVMNQAMHADHAILYLESWKLSKKIGYLEHAIKHLEPEDLKTIIKKFYRWGYGSSIYNSTYYDDFFKKRTERFRKGMFRKGLILASIGSILLLLIKAIPYKIGHYNAKLFAAKKSI